MKTSLRIAALASVLSPLLVAQTPSTAGKPTTATGQCKDGTYTTAIAKSSACKGHNGLREWYTTPSASALPTTSTAVPTPQPTTNNPQPIPARKGPKANLAATPVAPGGAPNLVWLNASSNVYHCYGTDFYGKTKSGSYLPEDEAKAKGAHGNRGTVCTK